MRNLTRKDFLKVSGVSLGALSLAALTGCSSGSSSESTSSSEDTSSEASSSSTEETTEAAETTEEESTGIVQTWPDGQVITWLIRDTSATEDWSIYYDLKAIHIMEEELNVQIEFTPFSNDDDLTPRLISGELPDLMSYKFAAYYSENGGITGLYNDGISADLTDMVANMPNLQAILEEYPDVYRDMINDEGKYLFFTGINPHVTALDNASSTTTGFGMRQDWLDAVGMDVPTTMDEWYEVLTAFKTMDPNGNGEADEIPFDASGSALIQFMGAYGIVSGIYVDADGNVGYGEYTQAYKSYLEEMNKWYTEGLLYNAFDDSGNSIAQDATGASNDNIVADLAGSWKALSNNNSKFIDSLLEKNPNAEFVAVPYPEMTDGSGIVYSTRADAATSITDSVYILVSTDCECMDAVAAVVDWMYSERGTNLLTWGEEGVTYTVDADGTKTMTEEGLEAYTMQNGVETQYYKTWGNYGNYFPFFGETAVRLAGRDDFYIESATIWGDSNFDLIYPSAISLSSEDADKVSTTNNSSLFDYISEMKWKFITGQEPISNFDTYMSNVQQMGMDDIIAVYQAAYENYLNK